MTALTIKAGQLPSKETLDRLSKLKDDDIVYDDDCPEMTPKMEKALACAASGYFIPAVSEVHILTCPEKRIGIRRSSFSG